MRYFAMLNDNYVCEGIDEVESESYIGNDHHIEISSYDTSLIYRKKYINGEWVDALPSETTLARDTELVHLPDDKFVNEAIGDLDQLSTSEKGSLVAAINELYSMIQANQSNS